MKITTIIFFIISLSFSISSTPTRIIFLNQTQYTIIIENMVNKLFFAKTDERLRISAFNSKEFIKEDNTISFGFALITNFGFSNFVYFPKINIQNAKNINIVFTETRNSILVICQEILMDNSTLTLSLNGLSFPLEVSKSLFKFKKIR